MARDASPSCKPPPVVSIVVLNWNGIADTLACLHSLASLQYSNFNAIVVDNGSTDDSSSRLKKYKASYPLTVIETGRNLGFAGGNNVGIRHALDGGADHILLLNNDATAAPDALGHLVHAAQRHPDAGVFSARVLYSREPTRVWFDGARWNRHSLRLEWPGQGAQENTLDSAIHETDYACGAALFFRAEVARQIGLLDEDFFLVWEEVDWCFRARKAGWRNLVVPAAKVWHKIGVSFGAESSPLRAYFSIRNELLWFDRHASRIARVRLWLKNLGRLVPVFTLGRDPSPWTRRLLWALRDYALAWLGRGNRLEYLAARRAIVDYVYRQFGDCPPVVRAWSKAWADQHTDG